GITCNIVEGWKPQEMKLKNYQLAIKNICERVRQTSGGERKWMHQYVLESWRIDSKQTSVLSDPSDPSHKLRGRIPAISAIMPLDF
ncbi:MAG: hypothetical protein EZS28_046918, partial [Streblomastix strix]